MEDRSPGLAFCADRAHPAGDLEAEVPAPKGCCSARSAGTGTSRRCMPIRGRQALAIQQAEWLEADGVGNPVKGNASNRAGDMP